MNINSLSRLLAGAAIAALALAGCGTGTSTGPAAGTPSPTTAAPAPAAHNQADVTFAQGMIPHHQQAVAMADLATGRAQHPQVHDLAARIKKAQDPEIATMTGWLREWGAAAPTTAMGGMDHGNMDQGAMTGMMSPEQTGQLEQAKGAAFDRLFLELMTEHHRGAIEMAKTEIARGADPRATQLAKAIIDAQQGEITEMTTLLSQV